MLCWRHPALLGHYLEEIPCPWLSKKQFSRVASFEINSLKWEGLPPSAQSHSSPVLTAGFMWATLSALPQTQSEILVRSV